MPDAGNGRNERGRKDHRVRARWSLPPGGSHGRSTEVTFMPSISNSRSKFALSLYANWGACLSLHMYCAPVCFRCGTTEHLSQQLQLDVNACRYISRCYIVTTLFHHSTLRLTFGTSILEQSLGLAQVGRARPRRQLVFLGRHFVLHTVDVAEQDADRGGRLGSARSRGQGGKHDGKVGR